MRFGRAPPSCIPRSRPTSPCHQPGCSVVARGSMKSLARGSAGRGRCGPGWPAGTCDSRNSAGTSPSQCSTTVFNHSVQHPDFGGRLDAVRPFAFPRRGASHVRFLEDTMSVVDGHLHDRLGVAGASKSNSPSPVVDGALQMTSQRLWMHLRPLRLRMPRLASVALTESHVLSGRSSVPRSRIEAQPRRRTAALRTDNQIARANTANANGTCTPMRPSTFASVIRWPSAV